MCWGGQIGLAVTSQPLPLGALGSGQRAGSALENTQSQDTAVPHWQCVGKVQHYRMRGERQLGPGSLRVGIGETGIDPPASKAQTEASSVCVSAQEQSRRLGKGRKGLQPVSLAGRARQFLMGSIVGESVH